MSTERLTQLLHSLEDYLQQTVDRSRAVSHYPPLREGGRPVAVISPSGSGQGYIGLWPCDFLPVLMADETALTPEEAGDLLEFLTEAVTGLQRTCDMVDENSRPHSGFFPEMPMTATLPALWIRTAARLEEMAGSDCLTSAAKKRWLGLFRRSLAQVEFVHRLVYIRPEKPGIGYGFHDVVKITGMDLMSSIHTCKGFETAQSFFRDVARDEELEEWAAAAQGIRDNLFRLYDKGTGMFLAGSVDCRQPDVMGSGLVCGLVSSTVREGIADFLYQNRDVLFREGFTRYIVEQDGWQALLTDDFVQNFPPGVFMNGAYWPSATGHVLPCLYQKYPEFALSLLEEAVSAMPKYQFPECVDADGQARHNTWYGMGIAMLVLAVRAILSGQSLYDVM